MLSSFTEERLELVTVSESLSFSVHEPLHCIAFSQSISSTVHESVHYIVFLSSFPSVYTNPCNVLCYAVAYNVLCVKVDFVECTRTLTLFCIVFLTGKYENGDDRLRQIADKVFEHHGYAATHPLTRNW